MSKTVRAAVQAMSLATMTARVRLALDDVAAAQRRLEDIVAADYRPGMRLAYHYRGGDREGVIVRIAYGRLFVRNDDTGRDYWIDASAIKWQPK